MQIHYGLTKLLSRHHVNQPAYALTFGKFDAFHLGHQDLLRALKKEAAALQCETLVISTLFAKFPAATQKIDGAPFFNADSTTATVATPYISPQAEREKILHAYGIDHLVYLCFARIKNLSYEEFLNQLLAFLPIKILVGSAKLTIGYNKLGTPQRIKTYLQHRKNILPPPASRFIPALNMDKEKLTQFLLKQHYGTEIYANSVKNIPDLCELARQTALPPTSLARFFRKQPLLSTTLIKEMVAAGQVALAWALLWLPYHLSGEVRRGKRLGRQLGYPTANIALAAGHSTLKEGVYATWFYETGNLHPAVTFIGVPLPKVIHDIPVKIIEHNEKTPPLPLAQQQKIEKISEITPKQVPNTNLTTPPQKTITIETYLLNFTGSLYRKHVTIYFMKYLRDNMIPKQYKELQTAIAHDIEAAQAYFTWGASHYIWGKVFAQLKIRIKTFHRLANLR